MPDSALFLLRDADEGIWLQWQFLGYPCWSRTPRIYFNYGNSFLARYGWLVHHQRRADLLVRMCFRVPHFGLASGSGSGSHSNSLSIFSVGTLIEGLLLASTRVSILRSFWTLNCGSLRMSPNTSIKRTSYLYINMAESTLPGIFYHPLADGCHTAEHAHNKQSNSN